LKHNSPSDREEPCLETVAAPDHRIRGYVLIAMFAGVSAAAGYLLIAVPNVEAFTALLFVAGVILGFRRGFVAAVIAALLYFGLNPQGGLFPPLLVAQILGIAAAPLAGSLFRRMRVRGLHRTLVLALAAILVTLWFDLITNLAFPLSVGFDREGILLTLAAGVPFSLVHIAGNVVLFLVLVPPLIDLVRRHRVAG